MTGPTVAIIAATEATAAKVAEHLALPSGDWFAPRSEASAMGREVSAIVYVDGWRASRSLTPAALYALTARSAGVEVIEVSNPYATASTARHAALALAAEARKAVPPPVPASPFGGEWLPPTPRHMRRSSWWRRLLGRRS